MVKEGKTLLLVEDDLADAQLIIKVLADSGIPVDITLARDGVEALDFLFRQGRYRGRSTSQPDLILLDLKMPKIDGFQLLQHIKSYKGLKSIPVVVFTSSTLDREVIESYRLGVSGFVNKPVDFEEYRERIHEIARYWLQVNVLPPSDLPSAFPDYQVPPEKSRNDISRQQRPS